VPFGGTTIPLFDTDNTLLKGRHRCIVHRHVVADGLSNSRTPYAIKPSRRNPINPSLHEPLVDSSAKEMDRLEGLMKRHEMGEIPENKWLDQLVFRQIEKMQRVTLANDIGPQHTSDGKELNGAKSDQDGEDEAGGKELDEKYFLYIEFPRFDHPVVFADHEYPAPPISSVQQHNASSSDIRLKPPPEVQYGPGINLQNSDDGMTDAGRMIKIFDPEVGIKDNPAESKHRRLVRNHRTGVLDRDLKPNANIRDELNVRTNWSLEVYMQMLCSTLN
jgi:phosphatidylinositol 3-kinase